MKRFVLCLALCAGCGQGAPPPCSVEACRPDAGSPYYCQQYTCKPADAGAVCVYSLPPDGGVVTCGASDCNLNSGCTSSASVSTKCVGGQCIGVVKDGG